jgi:hypothetical protein
VRGTAAAVVAAAALAAGGSALGRLARTPYSDFGAVLGALLARR